ncbi:MAG: anti-sigma factor [Candidatus Limnocylindrales bacterium]
MDHSGLRELIAGGVLGGLDRSERVTVDEHLSACGACRRLEGQLSGVAMELSLCVEPRHAPPALRGYVLGALPEVPRGSARWSLPARSGRASTWRGWAPAGLSFALAAALLVAGAGWLTARSELDETRALLAAATAEQSTQVAAMQVVADPSHATAWLEPSGAGFENAVLMVYLPGSEQAYLVASGLPATPEGRVYQFWHADATGVHAGLTFAVTEPEVVLIAVDLDLARAQAAMLTLEPVGGAQGQPGPDVVFGELPSS